MPNFASSNSSIGSRHNNQNNIDQMDPLSDHTDVDGDAIDVRERMNERRVNSITQRRSGRRRTSVRNHVDRRRARNARRMTTSSNNNIDSINNNNNNIVGDSEESDEESSDTPVNNSNTNLFSGNRRFAMLPPDDSVVPHKLSSFNFRCEYCQALHFDQERVKAGPNRNKFMLCCQAGKISFNQNNMNPQQRQLSRYALDDCPALFRNLLDHQIESCHACSSGEGRPGANCIELKRSKNYLKNIRQYNNAFALISLINRTNVPGHTSGPSVIKVHGQCYTVISDPVPSDQPLYSQFYFFDPQLANERRRNHEANGELDPQLMDTLLNYFMNANPFVQRYVTMYQMWQAERNRIDHTIPRMRTVTMGFVKGPDERRYNRPTAEDIAVIYFDETPPCSIYFSVNAAIEPPDNDQTRNGNLRAMNKNDPHVDPMAYPALFPTGIFGWEIGIPQNGFRTTTTQTTITCRQFYCHRIARRTDNKPESPLSILHKSQNLSQQYICHAFIRIEANNLEYIIHNQNRLRAASYRVLSDAISHEAESQQLFVSNDATIAQSNRVGRRIILPSTFHGSPRYMYQLYYDAMAMVSEFGIPNYFITFTCSSEWEEIKIIERNSLNASDLYARVFNLKVKALLEDLIHRQALGEVIAYNYSIEWQKRGMPHMHLLLTVAEHDKPLTSEAVDRVVSAHLPPQNNEALFDLVTKYMIHGPCGEIDPTRTCMENGRCSKRYPKEFSSETVVEGVNGYPKYKRPDDRNTFEKMVKGNSVILDNRHVVPYNPTLLLKYQSHINVEICSTVLAIKYIYKYCFKGVDMAACRLAIRNAQDEVELFKSGRYVTAPEAAWRLLSFKTDGSSHSVCRLPIHLPGEQCITFEEGNEEQAVQQAPKSMLEAFFQLNVDSPSNPPITYNSIPLTHTFNKRQGQWKRRQRAAKVIGRIHSVSPRDPERFALRLLLLNRPGPKSFEDLRTVHGVLCNTYCEAARRYELLEDNDIWDRTMEESCQSDMPRVIRANFAFILVFNNPTNATFLYNKYEEKMMADYLDGRNGTPLTFQQARFATLTYIQSILTDHNCELSNFNLQIPAIEPFDWSDENSAEQFDEDLPALNQDQISIYQAIITSVYNSHNNSSNAYFIDGPGGTGKTTLYKHLIRDIKRSGRSIIACAHTGIAAQLLPGGCTVHSTFSIRLKIDETTRSSLDVNSPRAQEIREASLIIWDEAPMSSGLMVKIVDEFLKDLMNDPRPFGGKVVVLGGDFRQVLPVVPNGGRPGQVLACIKNTSVWPYFKKHTLNINMRASNDVTYAEWLLKLGSGRLETTRQNLIEIPNELITTDSIEDFVYPERINPSESLNLMNCVILAVTNSQCDAVNSTVLERVESTNERIYLSIDSIENESDANETLEYPPEVLNRLFDASLPPHSLKLKVGAIVMLLRNLCKSDGLCNGTRMTVTELLGHCIRVKTINGKDWLIPMCDLTSSPNNLPFVLKRRQIPVKLAFCVTINKAQGQTFDKVGLHLKTPVFSHGQLYVAMSRVRSSNDIKIWLDPSLDANRPGYKHEDGKYYCRNEVWQEVLH